MTVPTSSGSDTRIAPESQAQRSKFRTFIRKNTPQDWSGRIAAAIVLTLLTLSLLAPLLTQDPNTQDLVSRLQPPTWLGGEGGFLGTDQLGRDVYARILSGIRSTFTVAVGGVVVGFVLGTTVGMIAGFYKGWAEQIIGYLSDVQLSFPALLVSMIFVYSIGRGVLPLVFILGIGSWMLYARMARAATMSVVSMGYVEAARTLGVPRYVILVRHVLPNIVGTLKGIASLELARLTLAEVALSFLGFGLSPPSVSLGMVLADGREYIADQWWIATFAGLAVAMVTVSLNLYSRSVESD